MESLTRHEESTKGFGDNGFSKETLMGGEAPTQFMAGDGVTMEEMDAFSLLVSLDVRSRGRRPNQLTRRLHHHPPDQLPGTDTEYLSK